jgi:hypothetical protein
MVDITCQYVGEGVKGGLLTVLVFIGIIVLRFRQLGRRLRILYLENDKSEAMAVWATGVGVFAHALSFLSVSYFDQIVII